MSEQIFKQKYLKYKNKYLALKGGDKDWKKEVAAQPTIRNLILLVKEAEKDQNLLKNKNTKFQFYKAVLEKIQKFKGEQPAETNCRCEEIYGITLKYRESSNTTNSDPLISDARQFCEKCVKAKPQLCSANAITQGIPGAEHAERLANSIFSNTAGLFTGAIGLPTELTKGDGYKNLTHPQGY